MAEKLVWALSNPKKVILAGKKAKLAILQNYSEEVILKKWLNLFDSVIERDR